MADMMGIPYKSNDFERARKTDDIYPVIGDGGVGRGSGVRGLASG
jgi:hypothetical protein